MLAWRHGARAFSGAVFVTVPFGTSVAASSRVRLKVSTGTVGGAPILKVMELLSTVLASSDAEAVIRPASPAW